ncbi:MAG: hypothetical protein Q4B42_04980 [Oscillospiraceae bacterium]|nr:hypothetical protein [Oscillospiraceae bacterium]
MKKLLALILALALVFALAACGQQAEQPAEGTAEGASESAAESAATPEPAVVSSGSKTADYFNRYFKGDQMTMSFSMPDITGVATMGMDGDNIFLEATAEGMSFRMVTDETVAYLILDDMQMYMTVSLEEAVETNPVDEFIDEDVSSEPSSTGTMDYEGASYDYEEFVSDDVVTRYLFSGSDLVYMLTMDGEEVGTWVKVESISNTVDSSKFEIPTGYTEMDLSGIAA